MTEISFLAKRIQFRAKQGLKAHRRNALLHFQFSSSLRRKALAQCRRLHPANSPIQRLPKRTAAAKQLLTGKVRPCNGPFGNVE
ncbi:hypothetical protein M514_03748 [Trichuris suis]|uniref:Uncharacterized protein n=1 Tax=Trichuris suis TaxID=68888 RepID=A0A085NGY9_9BILA|nr:hypothetical protein M513_03748 [Trichuris suis]KFD68735.1 hypothetical protein M514_03748 [Trichuris suis]